MTANTGQSPVEYVVGLSTHVENLHEFQLAVSEIEGPSLTLYLDVVGDFDPNNPASDIEQYVPGARLDDGSSVNLPQSVAVLAAYVDDAGKIVAPPTSDDVVFSFESVSKFRGRITAT